MSEPEDIHSRSPNVCASCSSLADGMAADTKGDRPPIHEMKPEPSIILEGMVVLLAAASMAQAASQLPAVPKLRLGDEAWPTAYSAELVVLPEQNT
jgi:hypothetical protein